MGIHSETDQNEIKRPCLQRLILNTGLIIQGGSALVAIALIIMTFLR